MQLKAKEVSVDIDRTALTFEDIGTQKYFKPEVPYIGEVSLTERNYPVSYTNHSTTGA